jgi:transglutaminase-like putative cysteine protease
MNRYQLVHRTEYRYDAEVTASYGRAHLTPRSIEGQRCLSSRLDVFPGVAERHEHQDFFGNLSTYFVVSTPHEKLSVTATSTVLVDRVAPDPAALEQPWETVRDALPSTAEERGFLLPSPMILLDEAVRAYAREAFGTGRPLGESLVAILAAIRRDFTYKSGATTIKTTVPEVLAKRSGVCQDFAHLVVGGLRSLGLAARYVSGYLETSPPPGQPKLRGADASHAWVSVFVPGHGWVDIDPTNNQFVDDRYVIASWGRDYGDVPPLKGVIETEAKQSTMHVSVDLSVLP